MHRMASTSATILVFVIAGGLTLGACSGASTPAAPSGASSSSSSAGSSSGATAGGGGAGTLAIHLTDSPFSDAKALLVTFSEVSVHTADPGDWKTLPFLSGAMRTCDLKQLSGPTDVLGVGPLPAGKYTQIRLTVQSAALYFDAAATPGPCAQTLSSPGTPIPLDIPSGEIKLNQEFTLTSAGLKITLDFDGDQSVHQTGAGNGKGNGGNGQGGGKYMMSPVIRVVSVQ